MPKYDYKPLDSDGCCVEAKGGSDEERYPSVYLDISPEQMKGLELDEDVEITLRGKIERMSSDTDDDYGTGANIRLSLRSSEIYSKAQENDIDEMLGDD